MLLNEVMRKLSTKKLRWVLRSVDKGEESVYRIAKQQKITPRWVRALRKRYLGVPRSSVFRGDVGRHRKPISDSDRELVLMTYDKLPMCATKLESYFGAVGMLHIPHNRINRILSEANLVSKSTVKIRRKKWVRYERRHTNSLWHMDICEYKGKNIISIIDDASRFIVGYAILKHATTEAILPVVKEAVRQYGVPKQLMTDHGAQFCANEEKTYLFRETLHKMGIKHIMARVKRPQSNGKIERWFGTMKRLFVHCNNDLDNVVKLYNNMPHLSLETTPAKAFQDKLCLKG